MEDGQGSGVLDACLLRDLRDQLLVHREHVDHVDALGQAVLTRCRVVAGPDCALCEQLDTLFGPQQIQVLVRSVEILESRGVKPAERCKPLVESR